MVICLERGANDLHMVQLMPLPPRHVFVHENTYWFNLSGASLPGCPGKEDTNWVSVCLSVWPHLA